MTAGGHLERDVGTEAVADDRVAVELAGELSGVRRVGLWRGVESGNGTPPKPGSVFAIASNPPAANAGVATRSS